MLTWAQLALKILNLINKILTFFKLQKAKQEGREEVASKINKETEKFKDEAKKPRNTDLTVDDVADRLRDRYRRSTAGVSGTTSNTAKSD